MNDTDSKSGADYRASHLNRGATYDANLAADAFDAYMAEMERIHLSHIVPELFPAGIPRYLDFACGTGRITQTISPFAKEAIGVDVSPTMMEKARAKCPKVQFIQEDLTRNRKALGQFDLVSAFRFFGNAQPELRALVLATLSDLVRPGGYLIVNNHRNPRSLAALFHKFTGGQMDMDLTHGLFRRLLSEHGFRIIKTLPIGARLYRSRLQGNVPFPDEEVLERERRFQHPMFTPISPDAILIAQRDA